MGECVVEGAVLWLALVLVEIGLQLLFGFAGIRGKLRPRPENQLADIAIGQARGAADESGDLEIALGHGNIMAGRGLGSQCVVSMFSGLSPGAYSFGFRRLGDGCSHQAATFCA